MSKQTHEFRDPIHTFIKVSKRERDQIIDSRPVQRLRNIHQLALTYLVYPGATHRRFEHSLGVMELADRVFRTITDSENRVTGLPEDLADFLFSASNDQQTERENWRRVVRMAALCHDVGHFPFSHAGESLGPIDPTQLALPAGQGKPIRWKHERLTQNLIRSDYLKMRLDDMAPSGSERTARLAVGQEKFVDANGRSTDFSTREAILSEIIVGDAFGVDRMDYLLRDSLHAGVAYGHFDHFRLVDTLRVLPTPPRDESERTSTVREPALGVDEGGLQSAEQLLLARHFMYTQVYFHPVRRAFDIHLMDFLAEWLPSGTFPWELEALLRLDDSHVLAAMTDAALGGTATDKQREAARRIVERRHFKVAWARNATDITKNPDAARLIYEALCREAQFGDERVRLDRFVPSNQEHEPDREDFPVLQSDGHTVRASAISTVIRNLPPVVIEYVFVAPELRDKARAWIESNKDDILKARPKEGDR